MNHLLRLIAIVGLVACALLLVGLGMAQSTSNLLAPVRLFFFLGLVALYLLPSALAFYRDCESALWITVVNVFLGWTIFGWVAAIGWAASGRIRKLPPTVTPPPVHVLQGH